MKKIIAIICIISIFLSMCFASSDSIRRFETLSKGDKVEKVRQLQIALIAQGYLSGSADGDFGKMTEAAVSAFQSANNLKANGIADEKTLTLLYEKESSRLENAVNAALEDSEESDKYDNKPTQPTPESTPQIQEKPINECSIEELVNICSAINQELQIRNQIDPFVVPVGKWTVGKHLIPGLYSIQPQKSDDFMNFIVTFNNSGHNTLDMESEAESGLLRHVLLSDGDEIEIKYSSVTFSSGTPYPHFKGEDYLKAPIIVANYSDDELRTKYTSIMTLISNQDIPEITVEGGLWVVGQDIPEGTYDINAYLNDEHGNYQFSLFTDESSIGDFSGELTMFGYGNKHDTSAANCQLKVGNLILASGCLVSLKVSDDDVFFGQ